MKKTILLGALLLPAVSLYAQESRQDISISAAALVPPQVNGNDAVYLSPTNTGGALLSYRFLLTPQSGLEVNYSFFQNTNYYKTNGVVITPIHSREQEGTVAYVYSRTYRRYNPFVQVGVGGLFFTPIQEGSGTLNAKQQTGIAGLFGGGLAYELSPSFDLRLEYRGLLSKTPSFGVSTFQTNRYEVISMPALGVAYHF
jgi:opacity protein-like surface antigen